MANQNIIGKTIVEVKRTGNNGHDYILPQNGDIIEKIFIEGGGYGFEKVTIKGQNVEIVEENIFNEIPKYSLFNQELKLFDDGFPIISVIFDPLILTITPCENYKGSFKVWIIYKNLDNESRQTLIDTPQKIHVKDDEYVEIHIILIFTWFKTR